jgi:hypothetical protein
MTVCFAWTRQLLLGNVARVNQSRGPLRKSCASISHNVLVWQLGENLRQTGAGIAVRSTRYQSAAR